MQTMAVCMNGPMTSCNSYRLSLAYGMVNERENLNWECLQVILNLLGEATREGQTRHKKSKSGGSSAIEFSKCLDTEMEALIDQ